MSFSGMWLLPNQQLWMFQCAHTAWLHVPCSLLNHQTYQCPCHAGSALCFYRINCFMYHSAPHQHPSCARLILHVPTIKQMRGEHLCSCCRAAAFQPWQLCAAVNNSEVMDCQGCGTLCFWAIILWRYCHGNGCGMAQQRAGTGLLGAAAHLPRCETLGLIFLLSGAFSLFLWILLWNVDSFYTCSSFWVCLQQMLLWEQAVRFKLLLSQF